MTNSETQYPPDNDEPQVESNNDGYYIVGAITIVLALLVSWGIGYIRRRIRKSKTVESPTVTVPPVELPTKAYEDNVDAEKKIDIQLNTETVTEEILKDIREHPEHWGTRSISTRMMLFEYEFPGRNYELRIVFNDGYDSNDFTSNFKNVSLNHNTDSIFTVEQQHKLFLAFQKWRAEKIDRVTKEQREREKHRTATLFPSAVITNK